MYHKNESSAHGLAIFYKKTLNLSNLQTQFLRYSTLCEDETMSQVALLISFEYANQPWNIVTTHLKAKSPFEHVRIKQVKGLLTYLLTSVYENIIICGDFNEIYDNAPCQLMKSAYCSVFSSCSDASDRDKSNCDSSNIDKNSKVFTTVKKRDQLVRREIDYIWVQKDSNIVVDLTNSKILIPTIPEIGLPSIEHPSDHLPLFATLITDI
jgi:endonuclease/exonuclease/phosphatase family metal-dependent hydrolase